mgnify:CR=1 FL=1
MKKIKKALPTIVGLVFYLYPNILEENNRNNFWFWFVGLAGTLFLLFLLKEIKE